MGSTHVGGAPEGFVLAERYGDFELIRLIATGGMAEIYLAKHDSFGGFTRTVVVKRMLPQLAVRPDFVQMFLDEARLAANLNHPNVVSVFNLGEVEHPSKSYFIAMEFVDGPHLGSLFAHSLRMRKALPIELCAYIVARAADGLHYAHEQSDPTTGNPLNLVHRDISPQNILVSRQGEVKVTDFGVAKASTQQTKTRTGIIKGKVAYMSPEQCLGEVVDRRTDVFALGIVLYELMTRRRLFRDKSDLLIMQKITGEDVAPASSVNKDLDAELDAICARALARGRDARFSSAGELAEALDSWLGTRNSGDSRAQLQKWFEHNAMELTLGADEASHPSIATAQVRPAGPGEATAATPSLNSAETVMRTSTGSRAGAPAKASVEVTDRQDVLSTQPPSQSQSSKSVRPPMQRPEESLPARPGTGEIQDEPTQRAKRGPGAPHPDDSSGARPIPFSPDDPDLMTTRLPTVDARMLAAALEVSGATASVAAAPPKRVPVAAIAAVVAVVVIAAVAVAINKSGGPNELAASVDGGAAAVPIVTAPDGKPAKLSLSSEPAVELLLDGKSVGKGPLTLDHPAGHVKVQALFDDQPPLVEELDVQPGEERSVKLLAKVPLIVHSTPAGGRIKIDNVPENSNTPYERAARLIPERPAIIRVELPGYAPVERTETPEAGKPLVIDVTLERMPSVVPLKEEHHPAAPQKPGTLKMRSTPWVNVRVQSSGLKFSTPGAVSVPAGQQRLILQNPEQNLNDQLVVTIPEDKELRVDLVYEQQKNGVWKLKSKQIR